MSIISNKLSPKEQSNRLSFQLEINDNNSISQIINADELIQPQQNKKQKLKKYLKDLMFFLRKKMVIINLIIIFLGMLSVISHYIYFKEYSICPYDNYDKCWNQYFIPFAQNEKNWGPYLYTNSLVFTYIFHCLLNKTVPRLYAISSIALYSYLWFFGDSESSIFNMIGTVKLLQMVFTGLFIIAYLTSYGLYLFCKKKIRSKYTLLATCITIIAISIIYQQAKDCSDWGQGINGKIEQTEGNCKMVIPNCFFLKIVAKIDLNFLYHNCFLGQNFKKIYNSYFSRDIANGTIIAFDDFKNSQSQIVVSASNFFNTIYDNAKRFKSIQQAKKDDKRYDVLFDTEHQRYIIKINRNQSLVTEKAQKWKKYQQSSSPPLAKNILMVFFDSLSRNQMHLKMPLLTQWLKKRSKFESYKQKEPKSINKIEQISPQIYYFYRYLSISATTMGNIWPFMYGNPEKIKDIQNFSNNSKIAKLVQNNQTRNGLFKNFVSQFDDRGFITGTSHTHCTPCVAQFFNYHKSHFQQPQFDHQTLSFNCDPNFINKQNFFGWMHGLSAMTDRCLYQKTIAQYNIEYAQSFLDAYKHQPKFYMLNFIEGHSHLGGYIKYIDSDVVDLLDRLEHKGMLDDTAILFLSDHGQHLSDYQSIVADHFNPMLSIYLPKQLNRNYRQKIRKNQQHTLSMFNLYHFVRHLVDGQGYHNKNFSLLNSLIQQRTCEDAFIFSGDCYCIAN